MSQLKEEILDRVEQALQTIRPHLVADGGDVQVVDFTEDSIVLIRWIGACESCSMSGMTLKAGIEYTIKSNVPEVQAVQAVK